MAFDEITLAEALRTKGYRTAFVGKWHLGPTAEYWPEAQGFEINIGGHHRGSPPSYFSPYHNPRLADGPPGEHLPDRLADEACRIMEQFKAEPFVVYIAHHSVHTPLQAPKQLVAKYEAKAKRLGLESRTEFADEEQVWPDAPARKVRTLQNHALYAAMVESMDAAVGKVLTKLKELGLEQNTIVCFTSDNGGLSTSEGSPTSNLPLRCGKGWVYEGGIREPLLVKWPGVAAAGSTCDVPVMSMDLYPTLLAAAGAELRAGQTVDGVSLVPLLKGDRMLARDALFWHYPHYSNQGGFPGGAVRMGDWKLVERYEDGRVHLYNLRDDVGETRDLAAEQAQRASDLRSKLHAWYRQVDARFLEPKPGGPAPWRP
jgi:arylsulfatase A-like enzyme